MAEPDLDRSHAATPYKLQKAHERGQAAKSPDVTSALVYTAAMVFLTWQGVAVWLQQFQFDGALLVRASSIDGSLQALWSLLERSIRSTLLLALPFFVTILVAAVVGNLIQTGPMLSSTPITPDWDRLNPVAGIKRIFSLRTLFLTARAIVKLIFLGAVGYFSLKSLLPQFHVVASLTPLGQVRELFDDFSSLGLKLSAVLVLIAFVDVLYVRREFAKKMRMSRREVKDEAKNREGDPRIRARLRELRREMVKRSLSMRKTRSADVVITNPTHLAVALRYVHGQMDSPQLLSKGRGFMALAIRKIAARYGIPVVHSPSLARALYQDLDINQHVRPDLYAQVARIIVWVLAKRDANERARAPQRQSVSAALGA